MSMTNINLRVSTQTKNDVKAYADDNGISMTAAFNLLIRKGLQAESARERKATR